MSNEIPNSELIGLQCPNCDSSKVKTELRINSFPYGVGDAAVELTAEVPVHICADCGQEFAGEIAAQLRHEAVCRHEKLLSPKEIVAVRSSYSLSRREFAIATRIGLATLARWEQGDTLQNGAMDNYVRLLMIRENFELISGAAKEEDEKESEVVKKAKERTPTPIHANVPIKFKSIRGLDTSKQEQLLQKSANFDLANPKIVAAAA
jgi:putative zinc finger/helix-turn-helix YgiT family protein